jgi:serine/threonine-protein kinase
MRQCLLCSRQYEESVQFCPHDGTALPPSDNLVGRIIDGKYRVESLHGSGGMGSVYRAVQVNLERVVALKVMRGDFLKDRTAAERFKREALAVARLKHPHIVTVYDFGVMPEGVAYLVMEYLDGKTLRAELQTRKKIPLGPAVELMRQVCSAVHAAHAEGVIHRDLKPDNIFLETTRDGSLAVKILDFGVAKLRLSQESQGVELTMSGVMLGTPVYMSPEQCHGDALDARTDIYSLGCVFYEMLTGRPPFVANSAPALIIKHASEAPEPPSRYATGVPAPIEHALLKALAKKPEERFQTAAEFGQALSSIWVPMDPDTSFPPVQAYGSGDYLSPPLQEFEDLVDGLFVVESSSTQRRRLAVLPFRNMTKDPEVEFLGLSLADTVITELSAEPALVVRPTPAIEQYSGVTLDTRDVSAKLDVELLVTGSFIKHGRSFQLNVQLIDVLNNSVMWRHRVTAAGDDIIALQDVASSHIVKGVRSKLGLSESEAPTSGAHTLAPAPHDTPAQPTPLPAMPSEPPASAAHDPFALELLEKARALGTATEVRQESIALLERSVALDPDNADAWALLATRAYDAASELFRGSNYAEMARTAAERCLALDKNRLGTDMALGRVLVEAGRAEEIARQAKALLAASPDRFAARFALGYAYRFGGLLDKALHEFRLAGRGDVDAVQWQVGTVYLQKRLYADAVRVLSELNNRSPRVDALFLIAIAKGSSGDVAGAADAVKEMAQMDPNNVYTLMGQVFVGRLQQRKVAALLGWLSDIQTQNVELRCWLAQIHAFAGDSAAALTNLEKAIGGGYFNAPYLAADPMLESVRDTQHGQRLIATARARHEAFARME